MKNAEIVGNDFPLQDHITPHYVYLALLKFHDIIKMYTRLFLYDHLCDKPCNFLISLVTEQHNYCILHKVHLLNSCLFPTLHVELI